MAVKLVTDSYQFWVAHLNLRVTFQSHIRFARKVQKYGDAISKSSSRLALETAVKDFVSSAHFDLCWLTLTMFLIAIYPLCLSHR